MLISQSKLRWIHWTNFTSLRFLVSHSQVSSWRVSCDRSISIQLSTVHLYLFHSSGCLDRSFFRARKLSSRGISCENTQQQKIQATKPLFTYCEKNRPLPRNSEVMEVIDAILLYLQLRFALSLVIVRSTCHNLLLPSNGLVSSIRKTAFITSIVHN